MVFAVLQNEILHWNLSGGEDAKHRVSTKTTSSIPKTNSDDILTGDKLSSR
jgi:hypothetical protein